MDAVSDYYVYRTFADRIAELHREADAHRLTRILAERHTAPFPRARRLAAGLTGLTVSRPARRTPAARPCPC